MDPALLNYLQAQNSQNQARDDQMQSQMQSMPPASDYNPFNAGITRAIESARASLGMTQKQQDKALRSAMLAFADNMSQQPREKGFFNNFASVGRALSPAISTYDQEEESALANNNQLANQILSYQAQEAQRRAIEEEKAWMRQHVEAQLAEQRRSSNLLNKFRKEKPEGKKNLTADKESIEFGKREGKAWGHREDYNTKTLIPDLSYQYQQNQEVLSNVNEFKNLLETSNLSGSSGLSSLKRYIARITGNDEDVVNAENMGQFFLEWLNSNTKGALSDKDIEIYSRGFAGIQKNKEGSIKILNRLADKLNRQQKSLSKKLELYDQDPGANLHSLNILNSNSILPPSALNEPDQGELNQTVEFIDPETGEYEIPIDLVESFIRQYPNAMRK